jgi:hypothetical protein
MLTLSVVSREHATLKSLLPQAVPGMVALWTP